MRAFHLLAALFPLATAPLAAQEKPGPLRLLGITIDHWGGAAGPAVLKPTVRATYLSRGRLGPDFALTIFPDGISLQPPAIVVGLQAGVAYRIPVGPVSLLPKGGGAAIMLVGAGGDQPIFLVPGVHLGLGLLLPLDAKSLIRADLTRHLYTLDGRGVGFWSIGLGFAIPRREAASRPAPD